MRGSAVVNVSERRKVTATTRISKVCRPMRKSLSYSGIVITSEEDEKMKEGEIGRGTHRFRKGNAEQYLVIKRFLKTVKNPPLSFTVYTFINICSISFPAINHPLLNHPPAN